MAANTLALLLVILFNNVIANSDENYVDSVIDLLLAGESFETEQSMEEGEGEVPTLSGGIWKCGNCADVDDSMLVYSEVNDLDSDVTEPLEVQVNIINRARIFHRTIGLSVPSMQCITVTGDRPGVVQRVAGACAGADVTLSLAAASRFTVNVYAF